MGKSADPEILQQYGLYPDKVLQDFITEKGKQICYLQNGNGVNPTPVVVGNFNDQFIEIKSGLREGDNVLLSPRATRDETDPSGSVVTAADSGVVIIFFLIILFLMIPFLIFIFPTVVFFALRRTVRSVVWLNAKPAKTLKIPKRGTRWSRSAPKPQSAKPPQLMLTRFMMP